MPDHDGTDTSLPNLDANNADECNLMKRDRRPLHETLNDTHVSYEGSDSFAESEGTDTRLASLDANNGDEYGPMNGDRPPSSETHDDTTMLFTESNSHPLGFMLSCR